VITLNHFHCIKLPRYDSVHGISHKVDVDWVGIVQLAHVEKVNVLDVREGPGHVCGRVHAQHLDVIMPLTRAPHVRVL
jgi:hypothetical protein